MRKSRRRRGMRWANQAAREITPRDYSLSCFEWHLSSLPDACFRFARVERWRPWRIKSRPSWSRIVEHTQVTAAHVSSSSTRVSSHRLHHSAKVTSLRVASLPFKRASVFKFIPTTARTMSSSSSTPVNPDVVNRVREVENKARAETPLASQSHRRSIADDSSSLWSYADHPVQANRRY